MHLPAGPLAHSRGGIFRLGGVHCRVSRTTHWSGLAIQEAKQAGCHCSGPGVDHRRNSGVGCWADQQLANKFKSSGTISN